jgi:MFS family permease
VWSVMQLVTGPLSDRLGRQPLIVWGMILQAVALAGMLLVPNFPGWVGATALLGLGTAMVYPTLIALISDEVSPDVRARSLGIYRFWRDLGYAVGALLAGVLADWLGSPWAIGIVAVLTLASGMVVAATRFSRPD